MYVQGTEVYWEHIYSGYNIIWWMKSTYTFTLKNQPADEKKNCF